MTVYRSERAFEEKRGDITQDILLGTRYEVEGFHLLAYDELEAFFDEPEPYLDIELTSAAVVVRVLDTNSILLVEFEVQDGKRVELPAGKVENFDESIADTALRELAEETGGMIAVSSKDIIPFAVTHHKDGRGGMQFYAQVPSIEIVQRDELGRGYTTPPDGTDNGRVKYLISEPVDVFLDSKRTLLRHSRNPWAVDDYFRTTWGLYLRGNRSGKIEQWSR